jgi:hypothetical protein
MLARRPEIVGRNRWEKVQSSEQVCILGTMRAVDDARGAQRSAPCIWSKSSADTLRSAAAWRT